MKLIKWILICVGLTSSLILLVMLNTKSGKDAFDDLFMAKNIVLNVSHADMRSIVTALKLYKMDNFQYPTQEQEQGLEALVNKPSTIPISQNYNENGYLKKIPKDPWGGDYHYFEIKNESGITIFLVNYGKDYIPGGKGENKDSSVIIK